jgi:hypothetical protein
MSSSGGAAVGMLPWQNQTLILNFLLYLFGCWHANIPSSRHTCWFGGMYYTMIWTILSIDFLLSLILSHEIQSCSCFSLPEIVFFFF